MYPSDWDFPGLIDRCERCKTECKPSYGTIDKENNLILKYDCGCGYSWFRKEEGPQIEVDRWDSPGRPRSFQK